MRSALRDLLARTVATYRPQLFYYKADRRRRGDLRVRTTSTFIDVISEHDARKVRFSRNNAVYLVDILNSFDYYFGSAAPIAVRDSGKTYRMVDFSTPRFHMVAGFDDFPVMCPSLTEPFVTTQQYLDFAELAPGHVVLDLGSYSALASIGFSKAVGEKGRVVALEPDPANHVAAKTNIALHERLNGLSNITLMQAAIADKAGHLELSAEGAMGSAITSAVGSYRGDVIRVESLSLEDVVARNQLTRVDFIKMDVEGAEELALRGAARFFERFRPRIIIEPHIVNGALSDKAVMAILGGYGYDCSVIEQIGVTLPLVTAVPRSS